MRKDFEKLGSKLAVSKLVKGMLKKRVINMERQSWSNSQYARWECLEVTGNPNSTESKDPEQTLLKVFGKMEVMVEPANVEDCHRIKNSNGFENFRNKKILQKYDFQRKSWKGWTSPLSKSGFESPLKESNIKNLSLNLYNSFYNNTALCLI